MDHLILEPVSEIVGAAGFTLFVVRLALASGAARRAFDADVKVIVMTVHWTDLGEPAPVALGFAAQRLLDGRIDEDALDVRLLRGIAADLMAGMAGKHRAAARLRHVTDQNAGPAGVLVHFLRQSLQQRDDLR